MNTIDIPEGAIDILNCGEGHLQVIFDEENPAELARAKRIILDMIKRGYAVFVHGEGDQLVRVRKFDPDHNTYIIDEPVSGAEPLPAQRGKPRKYSVRARRARATVVGRSAGG